MLDNKKTPSTIEEARQALQLVQLGDEFYIACRNPFDHPKLYRIIFDEHATYQMFEAYQKQMNGSN
ncbi:MAG: hypothetical protein NC087_05150 [Anaeroplasma bactoclasticum]|nr:hypothetical protein [Anaeroplasma bactoclasticum]